MRLPSRTLVLGERTLIMGVLNVTPDSFSDGGKFLEAGSGRCARARNAACAERTFSISAANRRGRDQSRCAQKEELGRILPVLKMLRGKLKIPISIDTQKAEVATGGDFRRRGNRE